MVKRTRAARLAPTVSTRRGDDSARAVRVTTATSSSILSITTTSPQRSPSLAPIATMPSHQSWQGTPPTNNGKQGCRSSSSPHPLHNLGRAPQITVQHTSHNIFAAASYSCIATSPTLSSWAANTLHSSTRDMQTGHQRHPALVPP